MVTPVNTDDLVQGCAKYLLAQPDVAAVLGTDQNTGAPLLLQYNMWAGMEGSQSTAAMLYRDGGWAGPNLHNTLRFPRLTLEVWVDPFREVRGNVIDPGEANRRIEHAYETIDWHLHRPQGGEQMWGTVRTIACVRLSEPTVYAVPDGDGSLRLVVAYAVTQG